MVEPRLKISPPWITYVNKLGALFGNDPDIEVVYDNSKCKVKLLVENADKCALLGALLPVEKMFGNVSLHVEVAPANGAEVKKIDIESYSVKAIFEVLFDRSPVFAYAHEIEGIFSNKITYVVFKNKVVQFFSDNLNDIHGNISTLYQDIASEVFEDSGLHGAFYCTDIEEKVGKPLGQWP